MVEYFRWLLAVRRRLSVFPGSIAFCLAALFWPAAQVWALSAVKSGSPVADLGGGRYSVTYTLSITNDDGTPGYYDVQAFDPLSNDFGSPTNNAGNVSAPGEYFVSNISVDTSGVVAGNPAFAPNASFNGSGAQTGVLANGAAGHLEPNDVLVMQFDVLFIPVIDQAPYVNSFTAAADITQNFVPNSQFTAVSNVDTLDLRTTLTPFTCSNTLYLSTGSPSQFNRIDFSTDSLVNIGNTSHGVAHNAIGYRVSDNLVYGFIRSTNRLVTIGADGTIIGRGTVSGLPNGVDIPGGAFVGDLLFVIPFGTGDLYAVDVGNTATLVGVGTGLTDVFDIALNPVDGQLYGVKDGPATLVRIDPTNAATTTVGSTGISEVGISAAYFDNTGNMYVFQNGDGRVYYVNTSDASTVVHTTLPVQTLGGGASCPLAIAPTPPLLNTALAANTGSRWWQRISNYTDRPHRRLQDSRRNLIFRERWIWRPSWGRPRQT
ncbi:MAG: hypothetical protein R3E84_14525 [Pseudomonadales bacterium]